MFPINIFGDLPQSLPGWILQERVSPRQARTGSPALLQQATALCYFSSGSDKLVIIHFSPSAGGGHEQLRQFRSRVQEIGERIPPALSNLSSALQLRIEDDSEAVATTMRDEQSAQRYARQLLHRLSQSFAFALGSGMRRADQRQPSAGAFCLALLRTN
jgi:hypothetical protein